MGLLCIIAELFYMILSMRGLDRASHRKGWCEVWHFSLWKKTELRLGYRACQSIGICIVTAFKPLQRASCCILETSVQAVLSTLPGVFPSCWHWTCEPCTHLNLVFLGMTPGANEEWLAIWFFRR